MFAVTLDFNQLMKNHDQTMNIKTMEKRQGRLIYFKVFTLWSYLANGCRFPAHVRPGIDDLFLAWNHLICLAIYKRGIEM